MLLLRRPIRNLRLLAFFEYGTFRGNCRYGFPDIFYSTASLPSALDRRYYSLDFSPGFAIHYLRSAWEAWPEVILTEADSNLALRLNLDVSNR